MLSVEEQDVDGKAHPESVNPVGRSYEETAAGCKRPTSHKAHEARECCIRNFDPIAKEGLAGRIGDA